jgi:hypothetical protein
MTDAASRFVTREYLSSQGSRSSFGPQAGQWTRRRMT